MKRTGVTLLDLIVVTVVILSVSILCIAQVATMDNIATRIKCASNLRQIGQAILLYTNDNRGMYPRTLASADKNVKPVWGTPYEANKDLGAGGDKDDVADPFGDSKLHQDKYDPQPNDVTAALYLLLRNEDITPEVFICPATFQDKWNFGGGKNTALNWTNWRGNATLRQSLSYSYQNPYPSKEAIASGFRLSNAITSDFAIVADMNPGTDALLTVTEQGSAQDMKTINSPNHNREGQNVMFGDGHVEFWQNPFVGVQRDNIYTTKVASTGLTGGPVVASPFDGNDSILLPTAIAIGSADEHGNLIGAKADTMTADQIKSFKDKFVGKYSRKYRDRDMILEVTDGKCVITNGAMTVNLDWQITGTIHGRIMLSLSGGGEKLPALIEFTNDRLSITGNEYLQGLWKRD